MTNDTDRTALIARLEAAEAGQDISLDRALYVAGRALPGWLRDVSEHKSGQWLASVSHPNRNEHALSGFAYAREDAPGYALCVAVLKAFGEGEDV